ncbi:hypothetical protein ScPMuIL_005192 [Solemya velum]
MHRQNQPVTKVVLVDSTDKEHAQGVTGTQFTHAVLQTKHRSKSNKKFWDSSKNVSTMQFSWVDWRNRSHWDTVHSSGITDKTLLQIEEKILEFLPKMLAQCNPLGWTGATGNHFIHSITNQGFYELRGTVLTYNNWRFSTYDRHHEGSGVNCAVDFKGAWWYSGLGRWYGGMGDVVFPT